MGLTKGASPKERNWKYLGAKITKEISGGSQIMILIWGEFTKPISGVSL